MELINKYIYAVGKELPIKGREEIKKEIKAALLDEIEEKYGTEPTTGQLEQCISAYGSPKQVATKYTGDKVVIAPVYTELYYLILKVVVLALTIAFSTVFIIGLFTNEFTMGFFLSGILKIPLTVFTAFSSATGMITLAFILISRYGTDQTIDLEEEWTVKKLDYIKPGLKAESKIECMISIFFLTILIVIFTFFPQVLLKVENLIIKTPLELGHRINLEVFKIFAYILSAIFILEIIYFSTILYYGVKTVFIAGIHLVINIITAAVLGIMLLNSNLVYDYKNPFGFMTVFVIILFIEIMDTIGETISLFRHIKKTT